jgi:hypothetical protein
VLRIIVLIQCDLCSDRLTEIASLKDPRETGDEGEDYSPLYQMHQLRLLAEENGWDSTDDSTVHHCPTCCRH